MLKKPCCFACGTLHLMFLFVLSSVVEPLHIFIYIQEGKESIKTVHQLSSNIYIYIFFKAVVIIMCDFFKVTKNTFFCYENISQPFRQLLLCKLQQYNSKMQLYYCGPCLTGRDSICCQQVLKTNTFKSYRTGKMFKIFHQLNCKSSHLIYLLQCQTCQPQYVGKSEISFNIRLNNH